MSTGTAGPNPQDVLLAGLLADAQAFGASFRLAGDRIRVEAAVGLPASLLSKLRDHRDNLWRIFKGPEADLPPRDLLARLGVEVVVPQSEAEALELIDEIEMDAELLGGGDQIGLDIETAALPGEENHPVFALSRKGVPLANQRSLKDKAGLDPRRAGIRLVQLYGGGKHCLVLDTRLVPLTVLEPLLSRSTAVIHNAAFELKFFHHAGIAVPQFECTLQATGLLLGVRRRGLHDAASAYLGLDLPKGLQTSDWGALVLSQGQLAYAALDAIIALRLWKKMQPELLSKGREPAYRLQRTLVPAAVRMMARGVPFDQVEHSRQRSEWATELTTEREAFQTATGTVPPKTPKQIAAYLERVLDKATLTDWPRTEKKRGLSTSTKHINRAAGRVPALRHLNEIDQREKLISSFGATLAAKVSKATGRLHAEFNIAGTKTGRATSTVPNMQQIPSAHRAPGFRNCFAMAPGRVCILGDYSAMELRAAAEVSDDRVMRADFANGVDLHRRQAAAMNGIPESAVSPEQRQGAKAINFGVIYGSGPAGLAASAWNTYGIVMTSEQAEDARNKFFERYVGLARWMRSNSDLCRQRGYIEIGVYGRVIETAWEPPLEREARVPAAIEFDDYHEDGMDSAGDGDDDSVDWLCNPPSRPRSNLSYTLCCNAPVQGACADVTMLAMILVDRAMIEADIDGGLILSVHDELVAEVPENRVDEAAVLLEQCMTRAFLKVFPKAPTRELIEIKRGKSWGEAKDHNAHI